MPSDIFDEVVVCSSCGKPMQKAVILRNGFRLRAWQCARCRKRLCHPGDVEEYKRFAQLRQKAFKVKLRLVGNSYVVSIPKEIVVFQQMMGNVHKEIERIGKMVKLWLEQPGKLALKFLEEENGS